MPTRLDRLFLLLQDKHNPLVRQTAAQQIGEICKIDGNKVDIILDSAYKLLFDSKWESRTSGGLVIEEILKHINVIYGKNEEKHLSVSAQGYDIKKVMNNSNHLTQSNTEQTYLDTFLTHHHHIEYELICLLLSERIGIISNEEELRLNKLKCEIIKTNNKDENTNNESDIPLHKIQSYLETLKETQNDNIKSTLKDDDFKLLMRVRSSLHPKNELMDNAVCINNGCIMFNEWYNKLLPYLLHSKWEYRHGASIGLRSLLKSLIYIGDNDDIFVSGSLMCLSVLILDRFFDFQSDILIAPISETVAQCLSLFIKYIKNESFVFIINKLLECADYKSWNIRYCAYLAFKYIVPLHFDRMNDELTQNIIKCSCNGMKDQMEDVRNMSSHLLLSSITVFNTADTMDQVFNALLHALDCIEEYSSSSLGVINVLYHVLKEFPHLIIQYIHKEENVKNIFNILLSIMNHSSISMKKQSIITLYSFMQFVHNHNIYVLQEKEIILWIQTVFEKIMFEENKKIKENIQLTKDNDHDEHQINLKYKDYINHLQKMWKWICDNLQYLIQTNNKTTNYQQMILKLFASFQKYAIFNDKTKEKEKEEIPTNQLLQEIETKKRKRMDNDNDNQQPTKKRKINSNNSHNLQNKKNNNHYEYPKEIILWSIIDRGSKLLSKLFTSKPFDTMIWSIVQHLLLQFLCQKQKKIYGWRRILGCWLLSDCYHQLKQYNKEETTKENHNLNDGINQLQKVNHSDIYGSYNEFKLKRKIIQHQIRNLIETFKECDTVYNDMNTYFNDSHFKDYILGVTTKYNEWKLMDKDGNNKERDECYKLLLSTVLNAQYALDHHGLSLQCSVSHILMNNGFILKDGVDIEGILEPVMTALKDGGNGYNLQYRSAEAMALTMKLLCDKEDIMIKIFNNIITECRGNMDVIPKDATRMAIQCICDVFGDDIFNKLPFILNKMKEILNTKDDDGFYCDRDWISMTQIFCCFVSSVSSSEMRNKYLLPFIDVMFDGIYLFEEEEKEDDDNIWSICNQSRYCIIEYLHFEPHIILPLIISRVIPCLNKDGMHRLGAVELIWNILSLIDNIQTNNIQNKDTKCMRYHNYSTLNVNQNGSKLLLNVIPYLSLLIVPLLQYQTDFDDKIRMRANQIFSISVRLIPLDIGINKKDIKIPLHLIEKRDENILILKQLIDPSSISDYKYEFKYNAVLRDYQRDGVNWLWFLHKFHLNGILADDMGLGKTLQSLLVITASYYECNDINPSLIVCPSTLIYHWLHEINKFMNFNNNNILIPFIIDGNRNKRRALYSKLLSMNNCKNMVVIMSYNILSNDICFLNELNKEWHYMILDEGHLIRNPKSKISQRVKMIGSSSKYRLILSGTPIQNNVLDLWSLFDFLMPGFLGNKSWFKSNFSLPIINSYKKSVNSNNGSIKLRHLHKQCLPFILRRLKCDVLKELPPKIIQDIEIEMSLIQKELYKEFMDSNNNKTQGIQSLIYLRKLVVHPKLIMTKEHPSFNKTLQMLQENDLSLESIEIAPKFIALKNLIKQCKDEHRMLIFVQFIESITLIERLLLNIYFPNLKYKTLSSKLSNNERFKCVEEFNKLNSPLSLLLMTVNVGGLGLNLNTADIVIFMEMDWNPMKDLQAMDRAHRIGQKKTVHVFRIITRNSIEEHIINKQKFKEYQANTIISTQNKSMHQITTNSGSILDLFYMKNNNIAINQNDEKCVDAFGKINEKTKKQKALHQMLDNLGNMTVIDQQYAEQYDLNNFIANLN